MTTALTEHWFQTTCNLSEKQRHDFDVYYQYLIEQNQVMNLTAITTREEVYRKHFYDSLQTMNGFSIPVTTLLDVGSGAGFPSLPLKIMRPDLQVVIVDALQKRIDFLSRLSEKLSMDQVTLVHSRIEDYSLKNHFDVVTARAVAKLPNLVEWCLPFVRVGGIFIAMKSIHYEEELALSMNAITQLGGANVKVIPYQLDTEITHVLIIIEKIKPTALIYPRSATLMKKKPL